VTALALPRFLCWGILGPMLTVDRSRRRSARRTVLALLLGLLVSGCRMESSTETNPPAAPTAPASAQVLIGDVSWYVDYEDAVAVARAADKPLWVHFGENPG
jgi:hypothetical protein